ncbi:hypothetical protein [Halosolutus gelatinilyticus]|uniref:hypothetical protein n=1 Tax=Halosolutus gelatinilyticus TaxID=2931975 RepID=UPI001FF67C0C|nr:hypothetical protein [Halosolutus gelatinilyticus]
MEDGDIDKRALQEELGQIKRAVGLQEEYPYWWRWWLVEGLGTGVIFPLLEWGIRDGFSAPLIVALVAVTLAHQLSLYRIQSRYERPTTGIPSWGQWHLALFAGTIAVFVGVRPFFDAVDGDEILTLWLVLVAGLLGLGYLYLGQLLRAYDIRKPDRYAFYTGGVWILVLAAAIPYVPAAHGFAFTIFGASYASYCILAYVVLSRV